MEVVHVHLAHAARPERLVRADRAPEGLRARVDPHVRLQTGLKDLQSVAQKLHRLRELANGRASMILPEVTIEILYSLPVESCELTEIRHTRASSSSWKQSRHLSKLFT